MFSIDRKTKPLQLVLHQGILWLQAISLFFLMADPTNFGKIGKSTRDLVSHSIATTRSKEWWRYSTMYTIVQADPIGDVSTVAQVDGHGARCGTFGIDLLGCGMDGSALQSPMSERNMCGKMMLIHRKCCPPTIVSQWVYHRKFTWQTFELRTWSWSVFTSWQPHTSCQSDGKWMDMNHPSSTNLDQ